MYKSAGLCLLFGLLGIYLFANISGSLRISPLLTKLQDNDFNGVVLYLRSIKSHSSFTDEFTRFKKRFGDRLHTHVFQESAARKNNIRNLERLLVKNPQSRDILYELYINHKANGNTAKATDYLKRAQAIDPEVK